ncbi:unnamed protein product [Cunninghamella echinulata]
MALSSKKKPSKPAFVVLRDEDIDNGVTEAQQPPSNDTTTSKTTISQQLQQQHDSFWTQSVPIGNTLNSQSSITSSPVHVDDTQDNFLKLLDKGKDIQNDGENDNDEEGIRIDELLDSDDDDNDNEEGDDDPFFDDLDDPFITKTNNKRRIPYASPYSNKRQCPFSVASTPGLHHRRIKGKSLFDENENDDDDDDDDDLLPPDSMLFTKNSNNKNNNNKNNNSTTSSSSSADDHDNLFLSEFNNNNSNNNNNFIPITRTDSLTTDDQVKSDTYSTSEPASPLNINNNNQDILSPKVITSSPIIEYSISESMTFPIEYHFDDDNDDDDVVNIIKAKEKDEGKGKEKENNNDNNNNDNTNYTPIDNIQHKAINENNYPYHSPPIIQEDEKIRSTVSSPTKSTILLSSPSKSQLKSTLTSPSKSPSSINISQLDTLPLSLPSEASLDVHIAYPNPRGKSILEKFDLSDK